jgi:hypothetical protein
VASKHLTNGRRALKDFVSHVEKCKSAPPFNNSLKALANVEAESFNELSHQQIGDHISALKAKWFCKDGSDKHVSAGRKQEQRSARIELMQLQAEFKKRLEALE